MTHISRNSESAPGAGQHSGCRPTSASRRSMIPRDASPDSPVDADLARVAAAWPTLPEAYPAGHAGVGGGRAGWCLTLHAACSQGFYAMIPIVPMPGSPHASRGRPEKTAVRAPYATPIGRLVAATSDTTPRLMRCHAVAPSSSDHRKAARASPCHNHIMVDHLFSRGVRQPEALRGRAAAEV
jgi:hypothetical protein